MKYDNYEHLSQIIKEVVSSRRHVFICAPGDVVCAEKRLRLDTLDLIFI